MSGMSTNLLPSMNLAGRAAMGFKDVSTPLGRYGETGVVTLHWGRGVNIGGENERAASALFGRASRLRTSGLAGLDIVLHGAKARGKASVPKLPDGWKSAVANLNQTYMRSFAMSPDTRHMRVDLFDANRPDVVNAFANGFVEGFNEALPALAASIAGANGMISTERLLPLSNSGVYWEYGSHLLWLGDEPKLQRLRIPVNVDRLPKLPKEIPVLEDATVWAMDRKPFDPLREGGRGVYVMVGIDTGDVDQFAHEMKGGMHYLNTMAWQAYQVFSLAKEHIRHMSWAYKYQYLLRSNDVSYVQVHLNPTKERVQRVISPLRLEDPMTSAIYDLGLGRTVIGENAMFLDLPLKSYHNNSPTDHFRVEDLLELAHKSDEG